MKKRILALIGALAFIAVPVLAADSIDDILANPNTFDGKHVSVQGTVKDVKQKTSRRGNDYTTFQICQKGCVNVYAHGHVGVTEGSTVTVGGDFTAVKHMGNFDITNQIEADDGTGTPAPAASAATSTPPAP